MSSVKQKFIDPLVMAFSLPPNADMDQAGWLRIYDEQLSGFTDSVLEAAAKNLIASRKMRSFPLVAECLEACRAAHESAMLRARVDEKGSTSRKNDPAFKDACRALADKLFASELGRQALKEDWGWTLHDWLMKNQRQPNRFEVEEIRKRGIANSRRFWTLVGYDDGIVDKRPTTFEGRKFIKWREAATDRLKQIIVERCHGV
jgi:hypothetical protein